MTTLRQRQHLVKKWRVAGKSQKSYNWIADKLGVSKPEAKRLENPEHIPGLRVQAQLEVTPVCPTCHRRLPSATPRPRAVQPNYVREFMKLPLVERHEIIRRIMLARGAYG